MGAGVEVNTQVLLCTEFSGARKMALCERAFYNTVLKAARRLLL